MLKEARALQNQIVEWRRAIHRQPELGFDLDHTARLVSDTLNQLGVKHKTGVGKAGIVGIVGQGSGPIIAIRADMDALPIQEENDVDYASTVPGCMHACGHDAHTAMLLGVAALLSQHELPPGQIRFLFQPSEEGAAEDGVSGAPRMIEDGAMEGVDTVIALHVDSTLETGDVAAGDGPVAAAVDDFEIEVLGQGGHGAYPHQTLDPIWLSSHVLDALYAIPSRMITPLQPCVVSVGIMRAGTARNIIPEKVYLEGTLRSFDPQVREQLIQDLEKTLAVTRALGGDYTLRIRHGYPPTMNDPAVAGWLRQVSSDLLGPEQVRAVQKVMGAEDFSYMTQLARGAMLRLGVTPPGHQPRHAHTATFDIDEDAMPVGTAILAETALRFLAGELNDPD